MKVNNDVPSPWTDEQCEFVLDLMNKAVACNDKTSAYKNAAIVFNDFDKFGVPLKVDDLPLFYIGCRLIPNMVNYLVGLLPQLLYPYIVAYLHQLSDEENHMTINDLYNLIKDIDKED